MTSTDDLDVYWSWLKKHGGVHGRNVASLWVDDQNSEQGTIAALEACRDKSSFEIVSGNADADLLGSARAWAERTHSLYVFNFASEQPHRLYSYSPFTSIETAGRMGAERMLSAHRDLSVGVLYRPGQSFEAAASSFRRTLAASGVKTAVEVTTTKNQLNYRDQIGALQGKADAVFLLDDPFAATAIIKQARQQGYAPFWLLIYPFNTITDALGSDAVSPHPIEALEPWSPYRPGVYDGPYARYGEEIRQFEEVFTAERGHSPTTDIEWTIWTAWRLVRLQLEACGRDCSRNEFLSTKWDSHPWCPIEPTAASSFRSKKLTLVRAYSPSPGLAAWAEVPNAICREHF